MSAGVSGRKLAAILGIAENSVRKAVKAKRIQALPDGSFDAEACRKTWSKTTDPGRIKVRAPADQGCAPVRTPAVRTEDDANLAVRVFAC